MISAGMRRICTSDVNELDDHSPSDPEDFCVVVRVIIASNDPAHIMKIISRFVERCTVNLGEKSPTS